MATDEERRKASNNLRDLADYPRVPLRYADQLCDELSAIVLPDGLEHEYSEILHRLADLIDPDTTTDTTNNRLENRLISPIASLTVDRDALIALADDIEHAGYNDWLSGGACGEFEQTEIARRIRKALVVSHAD